MEFLLAQIREVKWGSNLLVQMLSDCRILRSCLQCSPEEGRKLQNKGWLEGWVIRSCGSCSLSTYCVLRGKKT